jgi:hypothetical protein
LPTLPPSSKAISAPRCEQRFSKQLIEPSAARTAITGMMPTWLVR